MITEEAGQFFCVNELCGWVSLLYLGVAKKILTNKGSCLDKIAVDRGRFERIDDFPRNQAIDMIDKALKDIKGQGGSLLSVHY